MQGGRLTLDHCDDMDGSVAMDGGDGPCRRGSLFFNDCFGCGEAGRMVDGVVMERLREGSRLRTIGGGGGGRRVERRW
jgi:hypothetical protein